MIKKIVKKAVSEVKPKVTKKVVIVQEENTGDIYETPSYVSEIIASISHPNKRILAQKILDEVSFDSLVEEYGRTRVMEMQKYIQNFNLNKDKNCELIARRGTYGVCKACQK